MQCSGCGFVGEKVAACMGCQSAFYCGVECQTRDWNAGGHKDTCHLYRELCDLTANLSSNKDASLIEFRIKRPASSGAIDPTVTAKSKSSAEEDDDDTKGSSASASAGSSKDASPVRPLPSSTSAAAAAASGKVRDLRKELSPLTRDTLRIIALLTIVDAAQLRRASPAWSVLYNQIDWVQFVRSRWSDTTEPKVVKSIGRWLHDYSIFKLYPEALLERSLYTLSPEQNARFGQIRIDRMAAQEAARALARDGGADPDDPFVGGVDIPTLRDFEAREREVEYDVLFSRVMNANSLDPEVQRAFMNVCILYHMYEHNAREFEAANEAFPPDSASVILKLFNQQRLQPYDGYNSKYSFFFPVELLTTRIRVESGQAPLLQVIADEWTGEDPECLLEFAQYKAALRERATGLGLRQIKLRLQMTNMSNFPKALVKVASLIERIELDECKGWSRASFEALSRMNQHTTALTINLCDFSSGGIYADFYGTWSALKEVYITQAAFGTNIHVTPGALRPQISNPLAPLGAQYNRVIGDKYPRVALSIVRSPGFGNQAPPTTTKRLPPKQYLGLSEALYVLRVLSVNEPGKQLYAELVKTKMLLPELQEETVQPASQTEYDKLVQKFCLLLEKTGISPIEAAQDIKDDRNTALPFRRWFEQGLDYIDREGRQRLILSHARQLCKMSVERRRYVGAYPGLSELAEAFVAWNVSAVNIRVFQEKRSQGRTRYCTYVAGYTVAPSRSISHENSGDDARVRVTKPDDYDAYSPVFRIPHEIVYPLLQAASEMLFLARDNGKTGITLEFEWIIGTIPAWFWLFPRETRRVVIESSTKLGLPFQFMYHPGMSVLFVSNAIGWDTPDGLPQWDLFQLAKEAFPSEKQDRHAYQHAFSELYLSGITDLNMACFPPIDTTGYTGGFYLEGK